MRTPHTQVISQLATRESLLEEQLGKARAASPSFRSADDPALRIWRAATAARLHELKSLRKTLSSYGTTTYHRIPDA